MDPYGPRYFLDMYEADLDAEVEKIRKALLIPLSYHTHRSERSAPGFFDRVYCGRGGVLFRELKRCPEHATISAEQQQWVDGFTAAGYDAGFWNPLDLESGRIARELAVIANRPRRRSCTCC